MAEIIGREIEFGVATEATRGTPETAADKWMRKVIANVVERAAHAMDDATRGRMEDAEGRRVVQKHVEGDVEGPVHVDVLGWLLSNIYGVVVTSTVSGSVKQHIFTLGQNIQHPALTLFVKDGGVQQLNFANAMINTLELRVTQDDLMRFSASFIAGAAADNSDTPSYDTEYDFVSRDVTVKVADTEGGLAGAAATKAKEVTVRWDQGLLRDHVVGSYTPDDVYNSKLMIEGTIVLNLDDETFKDLYLGDSSKYMSITVTGETDIGGGNYPSVTLILYKAQIMDWNRSGGADELVTQTIQFRGFFNASDSKASQVTLINLTSSYDNVPSS